MKKDKKLKIINFIIIILLFVLFSFFYSKEFFVFHSEIGGKNFNIEQTKNTLSNFSLDKIRDLGITEVYETPDKNLLKTIVNKIGKAKKRIYVEAYIFTEKELRSSIIKAKKSGIDVKIILEKNVYMANNLNKNTYNEFIKNGIDVIRSDSKDYSLNHSKFFIIDDEFILSTGNFSYSMFSKNRDFVLFINDLVILNNMLINFQFDFYQNRDFVYDDNLLLSPFYSREKIEYLIKSANYNIKMYFPYFADDNLLAILEDKLDSGIDIEIITDKKNDRVEEFKNLGFKVKVLDKYTQHSKVILVDSSYIYIGSINFSKYSLDKNKETGIILKDKKIISKVENLFKKDFK